MIPNEREYKMPTNPINPLNVQRLSNNEASKLSFAMVTVNNVNRSRYMAKMPNSLVVIMSGIGITCSTYCNPETYS
jgi:hypothetical protein